MAVAQIKEQYGVDVEPETIQRSDLEEQINATDESTESLDAQRDALLAANAAMADSNVAELAKAQKEWNEALEEFNIKQTDKFADIFLELGRKRLDDLYIAILLC